MLARGSRFEDRYEVLGELGRGRFGRVYQARQLSTGQLVAIKLLSRRDGIDESSAFREAERFRRETRICAALSHSHLVQLIDSGETAEGHLYAVFAYVPGETLEQALAREEVLGVRESLRLMTQVLEALAYAHAKGIVHRDLKPSNLMLRGSSPRRDAVVLDFGVGGVAEDRRRAEWETLTQAREFVGTPRYASPEQLTGESATERSDLYSWGLIFLECLTGRPPFAEAGAMERLLTGGGTVEIPEWLRGHRLGALLEMVTAREPARRDLLAEALLETLDDVGRGKLPVAPATSRIPPPLAESGERRHLTVMFCDLVEATALSGQLDAETYGRILRAYQERSENAIERYDGHVVQHLGDGLLVYFGHPQAHDDDAERAVRAGRDILRDLRTLNSRLEAEHGLRLAVRVGIHTGPVVMGETGGGERKEWLALGDTPNRAARLAEIAEPDTVVISEATRGLVAGAVVTEDLGAPPLKGVAEPLRIHRVVQTLPRPFSPTPAAPFVGREQELGLLLDRFAQAQEGRGQAVWIAGEPGIGKTRLVQRLREGLGATPHGWLECRGSPYARHSALFPVIELVEQALRLDDVEDPAEKVDRLESALEIADLELAEAVPLFASLLSLRLPDRYASLEISPQLLRRKTLETLLSWVLAVGERQPVVLVVEDLQWVDPSTLEWLGLLIEQCPTASLLVIVTFRPEFEARWPARAHVQPIVLERLKREEARSLIARASAGAELPEALVQRIDARSDGVPLFIEELAKDVVESGRDLTGPVSDVDIPETLHDSLIARLDRLGEAKQLAQIGAAIGREFSYPLIAAIAPLGGEALRKGLERLVAAELLYQRGLPPGSRYTFKHALVQDAAYESLLESQRRELHGRIVDAMEQHLPERLEREPELLGHHCAMAGRIGDAIGHYRRAAESASQRFAQQEAIRHLREAIRLLGTLAPNPERQEQEIQLQIALGSARFASRGGWDAGAERAYARARELCGQAGDSPGLLRALIGLSLFHFSRGEVRLSCELAEQALELAKRGGEVYPQLVAHARLGITLLYRDPRRCHEHLERAVALYDPVAHRGLAPVWGQDWGTTARCFAAIDRFYRGRIDGARSLMAETVALARQGDPYSLSFTLAMAAALYHLLGERDEATATAEEALAIARARGFPTVLFIAGAYRAAAIGASEELEAIIRRTAASRIPPLVDWYEMLARVHLEVGGHLEEAQAAVQAGLDLSREIGVAHKKAKLLEVQARIRLECGDAEGAEHGFREALAVSHSGGLRVQELGAATSLARLMRDRNRRSEARAVLEPVYASFTEGFDAADLKQARALLEEL